MSSNEQIIFSASSEVTGTESAPSQSDDRQTTKSVEKAADNRDLSLRIDEDHKATATEATGSSEDETTVAASSSHQLSEVKESEDAQLGEEYSQKCKIGRGGIPKVPSTYLKVISCRR